MESPYMESPSTDQRDDFEGDPDIFSEGPPLASLDPSDPSSEEALPDQGDPSSPVVDPSDDFDPRIHQDVVGLMFLGYLAEDFEMLGHQFAQRTLKAAEELACYQVTKSYEGTLGEGKALAMATVGASLVTVDGKPLTRPLGPEQENVIAAVTQNFHYVGRNWYWPVIEALYSRYSNLMLRQNQAFMALEGKSSAGRPTS